MKNVFISYSLSDKDFVDWLVERLSREGISVWYDQNEIAVGDSISKKIDEGIESSSFIIIVLSKSSIKSKWVHYEFNEALVYGARRQGVRILPILIEDTIIPFDISNLRYSDFTKNKELALQELVQAIVRDERRVFQTPNWEEIDPITFEKLVYDLLVKEGFKIIQQTETKDIGIDFVAYYDKTLPGNLVSQEKWAVEAKFYKNSRLSVHSIAQVYGIAKLSKADAVLLVTNSYLTNSARDIIAHQIKDIKVMVWDETSLSDLLTKYTDIRDKYFKSPPITKGARVKILDPELTKINNLISKLKDCPEGKKGWKDYENICIEILNYLFVPPLKEPRIQSRTESGLDVRDALYPNRSNHPNWQFIRGDYDAKYIVFEFKNYSTTDDTSGIDKIVVNQVRNYLKQTIGKIGFVCSKKHPNSSGLQEQREAFVEDKKLILFLNNEHLIEMLMKKYRKEEPSDIIVELIDEFNLNF